MDLVRSFVGGWFCSSRACSCKYWTQSCFGARYGRKLEAGVDVRGAVEPPAKLPWQDLVNAFRTILTRVMGSEKKLHLPLAKDNPCVLTMKAALPRAAQDSDSRCGNR